MKGDTILDGVSYNKIYKSFQLNYWAHDTIINCFVRQDTALKKVYVRYPYETYNDSSEYVLYDFSVYTGDTILIKVLPNNISYPIAILADDTVPTFKVFPE